MPLPTRHGGHRALPMDAAAPLAYTAASVPPERSSMVKALSFALIACGIVLLYFGGQSFHSFSNDMSRLFTGAPTNRTILLIVGGVAATIAGLTGLATSGRRR
jgi:hypothetical protein